MMQSKPSTPRSSGDWTGCDQEPVQFIGAVQKHGAVLVFDPTPPYRLLGASVGWQELVRPSSAQADTLAQVFSPPVVEAVAQADENLRLVPEGADETVELSVHRSGDRLLVEAESLLGAASFDPVACLNACLLSMGRARNSGQLLTSLAENLRAGLSIERVMVYRFLPDWTGEVVSESSLSGPQYLGLRFPSTDIPKPAREIFSKVWIRHIGDVEAAAIPVHLASDSATSLDLTQLALRAPAEVHLEYLRNMQVGSSITLSLRVNGRLWGLLACHHHSAHRLRPSHRAALEVVAQVASNRLSEHLERETREERVRTEQLLAEVRAVLERQNSLELTGLSDTLRPLVESDMVAILDNSSWSCSDGHSTLALDRAGHFVRSQLGPEATRYFQTELPGDLMEGFAGVLALAPSGPQGPLICYFRREQAQSVRWAGVPDKTLGPDKRLHPRASFAEYLEVTRNRSLDWTDLDLWKGDRLVECYRAAAMALNYRLELENQALERSNSELDSFAYMASHDLKEPLRGIVNYASFLEEDYGDKLEGEALVYLQGLSTLSHRMTKLVDGLLAYSRLHHQDMELFPCSLEEIASESATLVRSTRGVEVKLCRPLPVVMAYPPFLTEIVQNLVTNAAKYCDRPDPEILVGALPENDHEWTFFVKDNGIGIAPEFHEEIFRLFRRLHGEGEHGGGTGLGLTIVKKMVDRHRGTLRLESSPGRGSTFYVTLPKPKRP